MAGPRVLGSKEPEQLGDYEIVTLLGEGGQGTVYLGESPGGALVAIKLLHTRFAADAETRRRFLREAEVAARVAPFCTAKVLGTGMLDERPYIVSEYIPGPSLDELVKTGGPRSGSGLERLAVATLTALASIHRAGVIHRDFKPGNVILGPEGPVVIDFGIARALDLLTSNSDVGGTPAYASPEQLSDEPMTAASDIFSWASTMIFAASGRLAFSATSVPAVLRAVLYDEPDLSDVPDPLRGLLAACLAKDAAARPTAADLLRALTGDDTDQTARDQTVVDQGDRDQIRQEQIRQEQSGRDQADGDRRRRDQPSWDQTAWGLRGLSQSATEQSDDQLLKETLADLPARHLTPANQVLDRHDTPELHGMAGESDKLVWGAETSATEGHGPGLFPRPVRTNPARQRAWGRVTTLTVMVVVVALAATGGVLFIPPLFSDPAENVAAGGRNAGVVIDQVTFSHVDVADQFTTDTFVDYAAHQPFRREPMPLISAGQGEFSGIGSAPFFGLFSGPNAPSSGEAVSVVTIGAFANSGQPEDSVFVGWVKGPNNYVTAWYNNTRKDSGFDVRVNGAFPRTYSVARLTLVPGDRFAVRLSGNAITSYMEHDGVWQRILTGTIGDVMATPQQRQQYRYGFGLRGSSGTVSITAFEGLTPQA